MQLACGTWTLQRREADVDPGIFPFGPSALPKGSPPLPAADRPPARVVLKLYLAGITPSSARALDSLRALCAKHLEGRYDLQVVDVYQQPALAASAGVYATPTLVKLHPLPLKRLTGDLSDEERVLAGLELP
jgi:circadian clock protein KaiB